ncbi:DNA polymerase delta small subunit [Porphyridium purpureum]|uniref:DNA polymerase delta small subunit n=1 Tax=Porphyridium purpureum TaxID=35688 RepID=A0A5J4YLF3_PORPP|nr:DNA polymerase delta small subunit [Porphyridium purpureum]|eukprot:POR7396..scf210_14
MCSEESTRAECAYAACGRPGDESAPPSFQVQFSQLYFTRLMQLRPHIARAARAQCCDSHVAPDGDGTSGGSAASPGAPSTHFAQRILEARRDAVSNVLIGVAFRSMIGKPSILAEYAAQEQNGTSLVPRPPQHSAHKYEQSASDTVILEDETSRVTLDLSHFSGPTVVSGLVIGVRGSESLISKGTFVVQDVIFPGLAPQPPLSSTGDVKGFRKTVCLVSGLNFEHKTSSTSQTLALNMLHELLMGNVGMHTSSAQIARLIVLGNSTAARSEQDKDAEYVRAVQRLDSFLSGVCASLPVHLLPGPSDPTSLLMPQLPFHQSLLKQSAMTGRLHREMNPSFFQLDGATFLCTGGQSVVDFLKYCPDEGASAACAMDQMLQCRHVAPTGPDTVPVQPLSAKDPFVLDETPRVFVAGNQAEFSTCLVQQDDITCRCIGIPAFSEKPSAVLLDLDSLEVNQIDLSV